VACLAWSVASFDICSSLAITDDEYELCLRCNTLGRRGGCSSCESFGGVCKWFYDSAFHESSTCGPSSMTDERLHEVESTLSHAPGLCPSDPTKAEHLVITSDDADLVGFQEYFPKAYSTGSGFCHFPTDPYFVDTFAHSYEADHWSNDNPEGDYPRLCEVTRLSMGLWVTASAQPFFNESRAWDKESLRNKLSSCIPIKRGLEDLAVTSNPWGSLRGLECIRAMQSAYCTVACSEYNSAEGRLCTNKNRDYLYRVCDIWTAGPGAYTGSPARNGCPLDPNNLPWDTVTDAFCDDDTFRLQPTFAFELKFGLHDPLEHFRP